jgi:hypothetical protein
MVQMDLTILSASGLYHDDWCGRLVEGKARANRLGSGLFVSAQMPFGMGPDEIALLNLSSGSIRSAVAEMTAINTPYRLELPVKIEAESTFPFRVFCTHTMASKGQDIRELSFQLLEIGLI